MSLGLSFIFHNNIRTIDFVLERVLPYVDEVVAVDTGSTDGTRERVERAIQHVGRPFYPSRVVSYEWNDDFSAARNAGWELLNSTYRMWMDTDEALLNGERLPEITAQLDKLSADAAAVPLVWGKEMYRSTRIVRAYAGFEWQSPLHERLVPTRRAAACQVNAVVFAHARLGEATDTSRNDRIALAHVRACEGRGAQPHPSVVYSLWRRGHPVSPSAQQEFVAWLNEREQLIEWIQPDGTRVTRLTTT